MDAPGEDSRTRKTKEVDMIGFRTIHSRDAEGGDAWSS